MEVNMVWLKRDVRTNDHVPLVHAGNDDIPSIILYLFEPSIMQTAESSPRHWQFAYQGLQDFEKKVGQNKVTILHAEAIDAFTLISQHFRIRQVLSHQETGLEVTYRRDQEVRAWCKNEGIIWKEFERDGVWRNIPNRIDWQEKWQDFMDQPIAELKLKKLDLIKPSTEIFPESLTDFPSYIYEKEDAVQPGGESNALEVLDSFITDRSQNYLKNLAKPYDSQESCSRLSPYLAYGQISARYVYQKTKKSQTVSPRNKEQFQNRVWWRSHYLQKLESDYTVESQHINQGFDDLKKPFREDYFKAWSTGNTGIPMVDASMRCLIHTGFVNFRMRAMLATFWSFTLWQDWRIGAEHLARLFQDFEPGIHFPQFQMQAGMTGYHPMRIFNPIIQGKKYDPEGKFIDKWVPELLAIPVDMKPAPWLIPPLEQQFYGFELGKDYPNPIVDYDQATRAAKDKYWPVRNSETVRKHLPEVWKKHCLPQDIINYSTALTQSGEVITESVMYEPDWNNNPPKAS